MVIFHNYFDITRGYKVFLVQTPIPWDLGTVVLIIIFTGNGKIVPPTQLYCFFLQSPHLHIFFCVWSNPTLAVYDLFGFVGGCIPFGKGLITYICLGYTTHTYIYIYIHLTSYNCVCPWMNHFHLHNKPQVFDRIARHDAWVNPQEAFRGHGGFVRRRAEGASVPHAPWMSVGWSMGMSQGWITQQ